ncbi:minor tail protein [Gordonia phage Ghobes]|uniref:Minor tail protein n=1 Tax=Gordonia phage Ghobes TaxID=1887647 RepID=A0A1B3B073_9CAUD|nr:minor tail protein [Gordonia phage Ghobes]AOE44378.1 minor tail protein [Gordonia phage Ghobes]
MAVGRDRFYFPPPQVPDDDALGNAQKLVEELALQQDLNQVDQKATDAKNGLEQLVTGVVGSGGVQDLVNDLLGLKSEQVAQSEAIANLEEVAAAGGVTQAWESNLNDLVTVPRALLIPQVSSLGSVTVSGTTGSGGASGGSHTHSFNDGAHTHSVNTKLPSFKPQANNVFGNSSGTVYFAPIVVNRTGYLDRFRLISGADTLLFTIDEYWLALFVYDPTDGYLKKVWQSDNLKDQLGNGLREVSFPMDLNQQVSPGQVLFPAHLQRQPALGGSTRTVAAVPQGGVSRASDVLLKASCYELSGQTSIPASVPLTGLAQNNDFVPWWAVSLQEA